VAIVYSLTSNPTNKENKKIQRGLFFWGLDMMLEAVAVAAIL
jgi:hypothetical protein